MKPFIHAKNSAKKFGGSYLDYLPIHNEMDSSKAALPDVMKSRDLFWIVQFGYSAAGNDLLGCANVS